MEYKSEYHENDDPKDPSEACLKKRRRKRQKLLVIDIFSDFARNTSMHGLKYVVEKGLTVIERLFWFMTFTLSIAMCFLLIRNVWIKWQTSPIIVSFNEQFVPVGKVPFPSVTICPQVKSMTSVYEYSAELKKYLDYVNRTTDSSLETQQTWEKLDNVGLVCDQGIQEMNLLRNTSDSTVVKHILEVAPNIDEAFHSCSWRGEDFECDAFFKRVLTSEGVCFNINALAAAEIFRNKSIQKEYKYLETATPSRNWSVTEGYTMSDPDPYPRRGRVRMLGAGQSENGASPDLQIILMEPRERDGLCNSLNKGFKVYLHHPADIPQSSMYYYAVLPKHVSLLALKFSMMSTAESLKDYSPEIRQCYFPSDRPLRYFNVYTPSNCRLECLANYTFQSCGCVWFHMPHSDSKTICTPSSSKCVEKALDELSHKEMKADIGLDVDACRCLPSCDSVQYDAENLNSKFDFITFMQTYGNLVNQDLHQLEEYQFSMIEMFFKESRFVSIRRTELFGLTDFLANCGGLLGLFSGFSFLSLIEIFYFPTLRLCCLLKRDLKAERENTEK